jgi:tetratricopeptide (TPR) repeat protein
MIRFDSRRSLLIGVFSVVLCGGALVFWISHRPQVPVPGSARYEEYAEVFQVGVAALDADVQKVADDNLTRAVQLVPEEPAAWADRGLLYLRSGRLEQAAKDLEQARQLAPDSPAIQKLLGLLDQRNGRFTEAAAHLRRAAESEPNDVENLYRLAQVVDQEQLPASDAEYQRLMERILAVQSDNLQVLLERLKVAIRRSEREIVDDTLKQFQKLAPHWSKLAQSTLEDLKKSLAGQLGPNAVDQMLILSNVLRAEPGFNRNYVAVNPPDTLAGASIEHFLRLKPVQPAPAAADLAMRFVAQALPLTPPGQWKYASPIWLTGDSSPSVVLANDQEIRLVRSEKILSSFPVSSAGILPLDWNNDFRTDLLVAGKIGLRFYEQQANGDFTDVTSKTRLPAEINGGDYYGAWAADIDLDGDLDVILARIAGDSLFLRNNFDGTFTAFPIFPGVSGLRAFAWADFDNDGAPDAALLDAAGHLHVFANERSGTFQTWPAPPPNDRFLALTIADADDDGVLDLIALRDDGVILRISDRNKRGAWDVAELARWDSFPNSNEPGAVRLVAADFDNNGSLDLLVSTAASSRVWLGTGHGNFVPLADEISVGNLSVADLDGDGKLDLLGVDGAGKTVLLHNACGVGYSWQIVRARAAKGNVQGDNRINSFGIGGEVELRTGTHVVKQPIAQPDVHFGLGKRTRADVIRIQWPNGVAQVEFDRPINEAIVAEQRLKGSCPFLFAWNGSAMEFVTDFLWSTPLGMYIQAQDKGGFLQTTDWVRIRGDQLVERDGSYDLAVNANLWETHYIDQAGLLVVDHPPNTEMLVDERFFLVPTKPAFHLVQDVHPVAKAWDHLERDATEEVRALDGVYLDRCGRGTYQGITRDHWVEIDLGDDAPRYGPLWLIACGWVHPTDSSINYALEQGTRPRPSALVLEVPDGKGGWKIGRDKLGFPAGKNKTLLIRLDGIDGPGVCRRFRLRTSMEIYWDALFYARDAQEQKAIVKAVEPSSADLHFRGVLQMTQKNPGSPELPHYDRIVAQGQPWRDLIGYYTRYGDVRELLQHVDDRYVIMNAGDEIRFRFPAPPPAEPGWRRDYIWVCDGWVKDGDLNTRFGKTVLPLPSHDQKSYNTPRQHLCDDPVYKRHAHDWDQYHTRFVSPEFYERGLHNFGLPVNQRSAEAQ